MWDYAKKCVLRQIPVDEATEQLDGNVEQIVWLFFWFKERPSNLAGRGLFQISTNRSSDRTWCLTISTFCSVF